MKKFISAVLCVVALVVGMATTNAGAIALGVDGVEAHKADLSPGLPVDTNLGVGQELKIPAQFIVAANADKEATSVLLLFNNGSKLSPAWFYLILLVLLFASLFWDDEKHTLSRRKKRKLS